MRTFIIILGIVAALVVGTVLYLLLTTPEVAPPLRFPLTSAQEEMLRRVPPAAEAYAFIPAPTVLLAKLEGNAVTREPVLRWKSEHALPPAAMLGRADAVLWKDGKATAYAVRFDPVRAVIVRAWTMFTGAQTAWDGRTLIIGADATVPLASAPSEWSLAQGLPEGDLLVVQRKASRGAFPPIGRPAATSVRVTADHIDLASRARTSEADGPATLAQTQFPRSPMLAVSFTRPPRVLGDLERLLAADVEALVGDGGTLALYGVDTGTLLPRPFAAIVVPADDDGRAAVARHDRVLGAMGEVRQSGAELVIAFDRNSASQYLKDGRVPQTWPANRWALRMDPQRLVPVLRKIGDNPALRFATPRVHRGARDLRRWMGALDQARSIEAAASVRGGIEELRVRVATK